MIDLGRFIAVTTYEDCPVDEEILTWDGCDFRVSHIEYDSDTGTYYAANGYEFIAYCELPCQEDAQRELGDAM